MGKFHINPQTGKPMPCHADEGNCPYGGGTKHFTSQQEAEKYSQQMFEKVVSGNTDDIADCLDNNFCKDDALKTARENGIDLLKYYESQGRLNDFPSIVGDKNLTKSEVEALYNKGVYGNYTDYNTYDCLSDESEIEDMAEEVEGYGDDYYIRDSFMEIAEGHTSYWNAEIMSTIKDNPYILEDALNEFGWYNDTSIEQYCQFAIANKKAGDLYANEEEIICNTLAKRVYGVDEGDNDAMEFMDCIKESTNEETFEDIMSKAVEEWKSGHDYAPPLRDWVFDDMGLTKEEFTE